jgi:acyl-CoA thioesterase I
MSTLGGVDRIVRKAGQGRLVAFFAWLAAMLALAMAISMPAIAAPKRLVVLGDSLSAGYNLPSDASYPAQLEAALKTKGINVSIENAGVSGDTSSGGLDRLDWSVADGVSGVIVALGANDALRGVDPAIPRKNLDEIVTRLQARGVKVFLIGMLAPPNNGQDYTLAFNSIYPDLAKKHGVPLYPFFLDGVITKKEFLLPDGIHPSREGVAEMVSRTLPMVEQWLEQIKAAS